MRVDGSEAIDGTDGDGDGKYSTKRRGRTGDRLWIVNATGTLHALT